MICVWSSRCHCHPINSCLIKIQIGFTFLVPAYPVCLGKKATKWVFCLFLMCRIEKCRCDFRRICQSQPDITEPRQQDIAMAATAVSSALPYNLYWSRKKIRKKIAHEVGSDSSQICKLQCVVYVTTAVEYNMWFSGHFLLLLSPFPLDAGDD